jgi:hypothetical protein
LPAQYTYRHTLTHAPLLLNAHIDKTGSLPCASAPPPPPRAAPALTRSECRARTRWQRRRPRAG